METLYIIGRLLGFVALLGFPQLLGYLALFRMKNYPRLVYFVGFAVTMISSFSLLQIIFATLKEEACGLVVMAQLVFVSFFLMVEAIGSLIVQSWFRRKNRS